MTPSGVKLKGKRLSLKYMLERGYPESDITSLRNSFKEEGWKTSERLPINWFYRQGDRLCFLSQNGSYFSSKVKALKYLKSENLTEDFEILFKFMENSTTQNNP